ncbi:class III lanthipeptide [Streptococcus pantholopis]
MKKILSLQTMSSVEQARFSSASNTSIICKKQSSISLFLCVKTTTNN